MRTDYERLDALGQGGQATTWRARRRGDGALVALKELHLARLQNWDALELFEREANALQSLQHPDIPRYIDSYTDGEGDALCLTLVQEFVQGQDLEREQAARGRWRADDVTRDLAQLLEVLIYLHERVPPVIHRDLKPSNLIRRPDGRICVVDFGAVRLHDGHTSRSLVIGTPGYMPMEQLVGRADPRSDLYALGVTMGQLWSGQPPTAVALRGGRLDFRPHITDPGPALAVIEGMLSPDADQRYPSARAALAALLAQAPRHHHLAPAPRDAPAHDLDHAALLRLIYGDKQQDIPVELPPTRAPESFSQSLWGQWRVQRPLDDGDPLHPWAQQARREGFTLQARQTLFDFPNTRTRELWLDPTGRVALILTRHGVNDNKGLVTKKIKGEGFLELVSALEGGALLRIHDDAEGAEVDGQLHLQSSGDFLTDLDRLRAQLARAERPPLTHLHPDALLALYDPEWFDLPPREPKEEGKGKYILLGLLLLPIALVVLLIYFLVEYPSGWKSQRRAWQQWLDEQQRLAASPSNLTTLPQDDAQPQTQTQPAEAQQKT